MRRTFTTVLFSLFFSLSFAQTTARAQRSPLPVRTPLPLSGSVSGTVRLTDCNATPANVRITAGGRSVHPRPLEDNAFVWTYTLTGLAPGTYTVTPVIDGGLCGGGAWAPASRGVTVESWLSSLRGVDFDFSGPRIVTRVNASLLASLLEGAFRGTVIHVNNYTPRKHRFDGRDSWLLSGDSFVTLPAALGGGTEHFELSEVSGGPLRYYVNDLNLARVFVRAQPDGFLVSFVFEDGGPVEIRGRCSNTISLIDPLCPAGSDSTAPDFHLDGARLDVTLTPARDARGNLTYGAVRASFRASVAGRGAGVLVEGLVEREVRQKVAQVLTAELDQGWRRDAVARLLRPELDRRGIGRILAVRFDRGDLVIDSYPR